MHQVTLESVMKEWSKLNKPTIDPILKYLRNNWTLQLVEKFGTVDDAGNHYNTRELDDRVKWTTEELEKWQGARRTAWDQWYFDDKRIAEKFITYYHLIWAR